MLLRVRFLLPFQTTCVFLSSMFFLGCVFSFTHRLRVCSFPLLFLCKFSSHYIGKRCVMWARGCWLAIDCHIPLAEFSSVHARSWLLLCFETVDCCHHSFWVCGYWCTLVLGCCWVVFAMLGPRKTLECGWTWAVFHLLFGVVTLLSLPSSQSCEWVVLLR